MLPYTNCSCVCNSIFNENDLFVSAKGNRFLLIFMTGANNSGERCIWRRDSELYSVLYSMMNQTRTTGVLLINGVLEALWHPIISSRFCVP